MARTSASVGALLLLLACGGAAALQPVLLPGIENDFADDTTASALPSHFDSREAFYGCADNVLNQVRVRV